MTRPSTRPSLLHLLFFFSGAAGLGYQMVWSKMFAAGLGHEIPAVLAVVCAFMGGMALGAWALDSVVSRSVHPGRWYAWLELLIGVWGFVAAILIPRVNDLALKLIGLEPSPFWHWTIAFFLPFVALLPATAAMGATLPAIERFVAPLTATRKCVGGLYAANTLGAVAGTLLSTFVIMPAFGFRSAVWILASANIVCGVVAFTVAQSVESCSRRREEAEMEALIESASLRRRLHFAMFATGLLGIGYEVVGIRVLSQVLENTVYTFATVLSVYLLGTSVGAALNQRFAKRPSGTVLLTRLLCALATSCALGIVALSRMPTLYRAARASLGDSPPAVLVAELLAAIAVFGLPTIFMGALFAELAQRLRCDEGGVGAAAALNTFGGALAAVLFAIVILPVIGAKWTLVSIAAGYTVVSVALFQWPSGLLAAVVVLVMTFPVNLQLVQLPPGHKLTQYREGVMDSVAVIENLEGQRTLRVNSRFQMGSTAAAAAEYRQAHIPLLLHANPKRALFLGVGTGITIGAATVHPNLRSDGVELVPEIVELMPAFEPHNFSPTHQPNLTIHIADARRFVRASDSTYDVIVADLFHPARDGAGSLYTVEHFRAIRERLAPGGLFCQWLPLYQLDEEMLRVIARTFLEIFPDAEGWLLQFNVDTPVLGLVGKTEPGAYDEQWIERRLAAPALETGLKKLALADSIRFFGCLVADAQMLWTFAADAPSNTDDLPRVTFDAPRFTYRKDALPYGRLLALLKLGNPDAHHTLMRRDNLQTAAFHERLARYWRARDVYLQALIADAGGKHSQAIDNFVESARLSDDFTPGYAQCLTIASLEAKSNPAKAEALLQRLIAAQPSRPVAREMLNRLAKPENKGAARQEP